MYCKTCHHEHEPDPEQTDGRDYSNPNFCISRLSSIIEELREALYGLLRLATKPQPRDEEEQEQVVAKVAKALKSAGKLAEDEEA